MRRLALLAVLACACGEADWVPAAREPDVISFSRWGDCGGADVVEDTEDYRFCTWGCAVVSYDGQPPCTEVARWTHTYDRAGDNVWTFRRQSWVPGCWELR